MANEGQGRAKIGPDGLNDRQRAFIAAYDGNGTQAAIAAGYAPKQARANAHSMLRNPRIAAAIRARDEELSRQRMESVAPAIKTRIERQVWWSAVMDDETADMGHRIKCSELLGKSEGDFLDRVRQEGDVTIHVVTGIDRGPGEAD